MVAASDVPDVYRPFVRMVNSYDRSHAFSVSIGFMRKVCCNGMVLEKSAIRFRFDHKRKDIEEQIQLRGHTGSLSQLPERSLSPS